MVSPLSNQVFGIGGGGSMFDPQFSPTNSQLIFVACDGSGLYRSDDGGTTWHLVDGRQAQGYGVYSGLGFPTLGFSVAFHPTDATKLLGARQYQGLKLSPDGGLTWPRFPQVASEPPLFSTGGGQVTAAAFDTGGSLAVAVWNAVAGTTTLFVFNGTTWTSSASLASKFVSRLVAVTDTTGKRFFFAALNDDVYRFDGSNWASITTGNGFPVTPRAVLGLGGSSDASGFAVYATVDTNPVGTHTTQIVKFTGNAWTSAIGNLQVLAGYYYEHVAMPLNDTQTVYLSGFNPPSLAPPNVWITTNGGGHWTGIYDGDPNFPGMTLNVTEGWNEVDFNWGFGGPALGLCVDPSNSQAAMLTNQAVVHMTSNGKAVLPLTVKWHQSYTANPAMLTGTGLNWTSIGLEVTTTWDYVVSGTNQFILYTDIGLARSNDGGFSWTSAAKDMSGKRWDNWYQMISVSGQLFAAVSQLHDLPFTEQWNNAHDGAVLTSIDNGFNWSRMTGTGLPTGLPVTSLAFGIVKNLSGVVGTSLLACVWDHTAPGQGGVYHSENMGSSWSGPLPGITSSTAPARCYRVLFDDNGDLYCVVSMPSGNVYRWDSNAKDPMGNPSPQFSQVPGLTTVFAQLGGQAFFHPADLTTRKSSAGKIELYLGTQGVQGGLLARLFKFDGAS